MNKLTIVKNLILLSFLIIISFSAQAQKEKTGNSIFEGSFLPNNFYPILPWDFLGQPEYDLKDVADCNFTIGGFIRPCDINKAEESGLKVIVDMDLDIWGHSLHRRIWRGLSDDEIDGKVRMLVENSGNSDAVIGYFIMDEPSAKDFPYLKKAVEAIKKYAPGKLAYINLFPDYATLWSIDNLDSQLGTKSYTEYLERYVNEVNPQFISYDNYMVQYSEDLDDHKRALSYFTNLMEIRRVAQKYGLPYWNIVSSRQLQGKHIPTPTNMLFHAYTSLAAGYNGLSWFQYNGGDNDFSPMNSKHEKTPSWYYMQEVNRQVLALGPIINNLKSTGIYFSSSFLGLDSLYAGLPGKIVQSVKCNGPLMIGEFSDEDGGQYAMIVNLSMEHSAKFSLSTKKGKEKVQVYIPSGKGQEAVLVKEKDINNHNNEYWLIAGGGVLVKFEK